MNAEKLPKQNIVLFNAKNLEQKTRGYRRSSDLKSVTLIMNHPKFFDEKLS